MMSFQEYARSLGLGDPIQKRIEEVLARIEILWPYEKFDDICINEYIDKEGSRIYEDLHVYSKTVGVNAIGFLQKDHFVLSIFRRDLDAIIIESKDYDFIKANAKSRLNIRGEFTNRTYTELKGSGENCDHQYSICKKYLQPRLIRPETPVFE
jgi:hypothetical protein